MTAADGSACAHSIYANPVTPIMKYGRRSCRFPSANDAARFFSASARRWPACSNRKFHYSDPGEPDKVWTVGPIANTNGTLSTSDTLKGGDGWACQRALTVRNNVAIDVAACSGNPTDAAVNIASQIADKVVFASS